MTKTGLDVLVESNFDIIKNHSVGVLAHAASVDSNLRHIISLVKNVPNCSLVKIFAPEHGLTGALQDMEVVETGLEQKTELPVISLYGNSPKSLSPSEKSLSDIDVLIVDLQDIGSRYYTYTQTLAYSMKVAAKTGTKVIVLDRPNPIGGTTIEGAMLTSECKSFCGLFPVANRHGLTIGEFATLMKKGFGQKENFEPGIDCDLEVIKMVDWKRSMYFEDTGLPWVPPSPNMPTNTAALIYPGSCLIEGTNLSEGRGTCTPLEILGAPFVKADEYAKAVMDESLELKGASLRTHGFVPKFQKWADKTCYGVQIHITDKKTFKPFRWGLALLSAANKLYKNEFSWRISNYEFIDDVPAIDLLFGGNNFRRTVETGKPLSGLEAELQKFETWYSKARAEFLLYE